MYCYYEKKTTALYAMVWINPIGISSVMEFRGINGYFVSDTMKIGLGVLRLGEHAETK
jgi:hypothetical protein